MIMATDFAPGGAKKIPCAKEAAHYTVTPWSSKVMIDQRRRITVPNKAPICDADHIVNPSWPAPSLYGIGLTTLLRRLADFVQTRFVMLLQME